MLDVKDALDGIFLGCFFFGLLFSIGSLVLGVADLGLDVDGDGAGDLGPINVSTILAFVAWFGGIGYLARSGFGAVAVLSLAIAIVGGLAGAAFVWWVLRKLKRSEHVLDPRDYRLPGTIARVTSGIRVGGVGEIIYEQQGIRQVSAARSLEGKAIARGTEVVVMQTAGGIALVQPFEEILDDDRSPDPERDPTRVTVT